MPDPSTLVIGCQARTIITPGVLTCLVEDVDNGCHQLNPLATCDLEDGHPGPHLSISQTDLDGMMDYWVEWTGQRLVAIPTCPSTFEGTPRHDYGDEDLPIDCWLPEHHPGHHNGGRRDLWWS